MANPVFGYRPPANRNIIPVGTPVAVIASFKPSGDFIPLYFQVEDYNGERFKYKISSISRIKDKPGIKIFICSFVSNGYKIPIVLIFEIDTMRWVIG